VSAEEAELLGVEAGAPAFLFERTSRTADGRVAEFVRSIYRGDRYRLVTDLSSRGELGPGGMSWVPREDGVRIG
jgi:GntR family transcriptional regulator